MTHYKLNEELAPLADDLIEQLEDAGVLVPVTIDIESMARQIAYDNDWLWDKISQSEKEYWERLAHSYLGAAVGEDKT